MPARLDRSPGDTVRGGGIERSTLAAEGHELIDADARADHEVAEGVAA